MKRKTFTIFQAKKNFYSILFSSFFLLLFGFIPLNAQYKLHGSPKALPDSNIGSITEFPKVVINYSMIEKFEKTNFSVGQKGFHGMMQTYNLDSMRIALETYCVKDVGEVPTATIISADSISPEPQKLNRVKSSDKNL